MFKALVILTQLSTTQPQTYIEQNKQQYTWQEQMGIGAPTYPSHNGSVGSAGQKGAHPEEFELMVPTQ